MPLVEIHWRPTDRQLRQFSGACLAAPALLAWLATRDWRWVLLAGGFGGGLGVAGLLRPQLVRPIFVGLSLLTAPIGMVVGETALLAVYLLIVTPIGLLLRVCGKDPLAKRPSRGDEKENETYWEPYPQAASPRQYYRQS